MMTLLSLLLTIGAFASFALATVKHHQRFLHTLPSTQRVTRMRALAWAAIALAFAPAVAAHGWVFGPIIWSGLVMLGAGVAFLGLNFWPAPAPSKTAKGE